MSKFKIIIADPPWQTSDKLTMSAVKRGAESHYNTMSTKELCELPINDMANQSGCVLALWVIGSMLDDGMQVMKAWGFSQKQVYVWCKTKKEPLEDLADIVVSSLKELSASPNKYKSIKQGISTIVKSARLDNVLGFGLGRLFRQSHEICLIGINDTGIYKSLKNKSQRSVCFSQNKGHSIKPDELHESLEKMFPYSVNERCELFARRKRDGWITIGNEIDGKDIRTAINELINVSA
jgi:N6-adenosine-specific RNA methylase IME4